MIPIKFPLSLSGCTCGVSYSRYIIYRRIIDNLNRNIICPFFTKEILFFWLLKADSCDILTEMTAMRNSSGRRNGRTSLWWWRDFTKSASCMEIQLITKWQNIMFRLCLIKIKIFDNRTKKYIRKKCRCSWKYIRSAGFRRKYGGRYLSIKVADYHNLRHEYSTACIYAYYTQFIRILQYKMKPMFSVRTVNWTVKIISISIQARLIWGRRLWYFATFIQACLFIWGIPMETEAPVQAGYDAAGRQEERWYARLQSMGRRERDGPGVRMGREKSGMVQM